MDCALMICRAVHFSASLTLFGMLAFRHTLAPRSVATALSRLLKRMTTACAATAVLTGLIWLVLLGAAMGDGWRGFASIGTLKTVLFDTQFGMVWQWHMGLSIGLVALLPYDDRLPERLGSWLIPLVAGAQLATLGLVGHAAMLTGAAGIANRTAQVLHLLAAGFWLGSLIPVVLCLRVRATDALRRDAMTALRRFSNVGHLSVAVVVLTGLANMALIEGHLALDLATPYRQLLAVKIGVVAAMIGLAVTNRYWLVPRLRRDAAAIDHIRRICIAVYCLGLGAVALVSVFGMLTPT